MRDYHRRRVQKANQNADTIQAPAPKPPSAKAQTQKFRFGKEKGLRPWVPVKGSPGKRRPGGKGRGKASSSEGSHEASSTPSSVNRGQLLSNSTLSAQDFASMSFSGTGPVTASADRWLSSLDFAIQTSMLYHSPGTGILDPFAATSLIITPRTQVLIHHYCKLHETFTSFRDLRLIIC